MSVRNAVRIGRGSIAGTFTPRSDRLPGLRGSIAFDQDITIRAGRHIFLTGWVRIEPASGAPFVSLVVEQDQRGRA